jgi:DNA invertase Pin-like site-specific DNA recombinase
MIYGYARVSSFGQAKDGNSLEAQESALRSRGCEVVYTEAFTGTTNDRPKFNELVSKLQAGDTLMVTKLDRFSRSASKGAELIKELLERGVIVDILNMGRADNSPNGKLMLNILFAFAEFERDNIVERTSEGKAIAKAKGKRVNGFEKREIPEFEKFFQKNKKGEMSVVDCCKLLGISRKTWYNRVNDLNLCM